MNRTKFMHSVLATAILASIATAAVADVKVRLKSDNAFVVEDRATGTDKFVINETVGATTGSPTTTGISAGNNAIGDVLDPVQDQDAATKAYVDSSDKTGFVADHEGWLHPTIEIGTQTWMADNMYVTSYPGANASGYSGGTVGTDIAHSASSAWNVDNGKFSFPQRQDYYSGVAVPAASEVNKHSVYRKMFGNFYQWSAAMDNAASDAVVPGATQGICPAGWHVPTDGDWDVLEVALGGTAGGSGWRNPGVGTALKAGGTSGFSALLAGLRATPSGSFYVRGIRAYFWSATEASAATAFRRSLYAAEARVYRAAHSKAYGLSVRCLKD